MNINILIVGVGGQGTLLASKILGEFAAGRELDCKLSEVHGMAQRGGSVVSHVKISSKVYSPIIAEGEADIILAFEELEALRSRHFLKKEGLMLINRQEIYPMPVIVGAVKYPENIMESIKGEGINVKAIDAMGLAQESGNIKAANTVMIGVMARELGIPLAEMNGILERVLAGKLLEVNIKALEAGYNKGV